MISVSGGNITTAPDREHLLARLVRRLLAAISGKQTTIGEAGLEVPALGTVQWRDVLAIYRERERGKRLSALTTAPISEFPWAG